VRVLVTGGAGFIGSHLCDALLNRNFDVVSVDHAKNVKNIEHISFSKRFQHHTFDINDVYELREVSKGCETIFHLASNSDIRLSETDARIDFYNTFKTTWSVMETARLNSINKVYFSSSSAVYGNRPDVVFSESMGDIQPISYYGSCKLSSESLISAYSSLNSIDALIFRISNVVGPRMTHGVVSDFMKKLKNDPKNLEILGNGLQSKEYLHVEDLIEGICGFMQRIDPGVSIYNVSTESSITVNEIADMVCSGMGLSDVNYNYVDGAQGWKGDVPKYRLNISKARSNGWKYKYDSSAAIKKTIEYFVK